MNSLKARSMFRFIIFAFAVLIAPQAWSQTSIVMDRTGDGTTSLSYPNALAVDSEGNVYVAGDDENVFRIRPNGEASVVMDSSGDGIHALSLISALVVDSQDNLYVAGWSSSNVFRRSPEGVVTQVLDSSGDGVTAFSSVLSLAVDAADNVYAGVAVSNSTYRISPSGTITQVSDSSGVGSCDMGLVYNLAVDGAGNIYVASYLTDCVFKVAPDGSKSVLLDARGDGIHALDGPSEVAVDSVGNVYVTGFLSNNLFKISTNGTSRQLIDYQGNGEHQFITPDSLAIDQDDTAYVGSRGTNTLFEVTADEQVHVVLDPSGNGVGNFDQPIDIALHDGFVYTAGKSSDNVFRIGLGCEAPPSIDYGGYSAASCSGTSTAYDQSELNAYLSDFGASAGHPSNLIVAFAPTGRVQITSPCRVDIQGPGNMIDIEARNLCVYGRAGVRLGTGGQQPGSRVELAGDLYLISEEGPSKSEKHMTVTADNMRLESYGEARIGKQSTTLLDGALTAYSHAGSVEIAKDIEARANTIDMNAANRVHVRDRSELHGRHGVELRSRAASNAWGVILRYFTTVTSAQETVDLTGPTISVSYGSVVTAARAVAVGSLGLGASNSITVTNGALQSGTVILYSDGLLNVQNSVLEAGLLQLDGGSCSVSGNEVSAITTVGSCAP